MKCFLCSFTLLLIMFFISGCYTLIEHPDIKITENGKSYDATIMFFDNCADCHSTDEIAEYYFLASDQVLSPHQLNDEKFYQIAEKGNYDFFYNSVWWFEDDYQYNFIDDEYSSVIDSVNKSQNIICTRKLIK